MLYPGLKKLAGELEFKNNGTIHYGFVKNSYVIFADGANQKNVWIQFAKTPDDDDKAKINSWTKKGYAKKIEFLDDDSFHIKITFAEYFIPFKISKIKEVIIDICDYFAEKYPDAKITCSQCNTSTDTAIYEIANVPMPVCSSCAASIASKIEEIYEEEDAKENNYVAGTLTAIIFALPAILAHIFFFVLGRIAAITGALYYFLAQKGYSKAGGKQNKVAVLIIAVISFLYTILGTIVGYTANLFIEAKKIPEFKGLANSELFRIVLSVFNDPEVRSELRSNILLSLFICGIVIVVYMFQGFKDTKKVDVKKM